MIDYNKIKNTLMKDDVYIKKAKLDSKLRKDFLPHIVPILGSLPIVSNKISESLTNIPDSIETPNWIVNKKQMSAAIKIAYAVPRQVLYTPGTKENRYKGLTPLLMYALREHQGIKYSYWDKSDPMIKILLGLSLHTWIFNPTTCKGIPMASKKDILDARSVQLGKYAQTSNRIAPGIKIAKYSYAKLLMMQCWIACPEERIVDAMILDTEDWDNIPEVIG